MNPVRKFEEMLNLGACKSTKLHGISRWTGSTNKGGEQKEALGSNAMRKASPAPLPEIEQHQAAEPNEASQNDSIPPLLGSDLSHQVVHARNLACSAHNAPVDAG